MVFSLLCSVEEFMMILEKLKKQTLSKLYITVYMNKILDGFTLLADIARYWNSYFEKYVAIYVSFNSLYF